MRITFKSIILLAALAFTPSAVSAQETAKTEGAKEASIKLKSLDGKVFDTEAVLGEVWVASFGATWCVPCVWELKAIEELVEEYAGKPVRFLWISIESKERTSDAILRNFAKTYRLTIPVLRDADGAAFTQFSDSRRRLPLVVYFDKEGRFVAPTQRGMSTDPIQYKEKVRKRVDALLGASTGEKQATGTK